MLDETKLEQEIQALPKTHQIAFAASCCQRMITNYVAFCQLEGWGKPDEVEQVLDEVWTSLLAGPLSPQRLRDLLRLFSKDPNVIPEPGEFRSILTDAAYLTVGAVDGLLQCYRSGKVEDIINIAKISLEALTGYVETMGNPNTEEYQAHNPELTEWARQSPLVAREIEAQEQDLALLKTHSLLDAALIHSLRSSSDKIGIQPFRRRLVKRAETRN